MQTRGLWCGASDCGFSRDDVVEFVSKVADSGFNLLLPELKGGHGLLRYPSKLFPNAVEKPYDEFDLPAHLLEECRKRGVELHAWFIDFFDSEDGPAHRSHPEWAMRDSQGRATNDEMLRGERFTGVWMCPANVAGYSGAFLLRVYSEFARLYGFDAVHHDYVRYPGDLAPDQYCFCDHCLEAVPRWAGYLNPAYPDEPFDHALYDREYLEAHWEQSPRVLPTYWSKLNRMEKSRFMLEGSYFRGGRNDLDYFFYQYRKEVIGGFVRTAHEWVKRERPEMGVSAAVFKNPIHSGRFIGQAWHEWNGHVDTMIPMDYRDHFPGTFDHYLGLLATAIESQIGWSTEAKAERYLTGFALWSLIRDEPEDRRGDFMVETIKLIADKGEHGCCVFCAGDLTRYGLWERAAGALR